MRIGFTFASLALGALALAGSSRAAEKVDLKVGDKAPAFEAKDESGKPWKSSDYVGKKIVVLFFYPGATTGGCTKQACAYRDSLSKLKEKDVEVVGVSGDSPEGQMVFKKKEMLTYTLLADEKGEVAKAFGVAIMKESPTPMKVKDADGKTVEWQRGVTEQRWTFVIDKAGKIAAKKTKVDVTKDATEVLETVEKSK